MAEEEYQIPIFFINGQLDSGKTRFITETIEMGQFAEAKNKLLIVCEEGEEEYDEKMLKDNGVSMVVLEKEDLTEEKLKELDKQYDPWIVIVEYNGMWDPALLMGTAKPFGWQIYQSITLVNAETFGVQWANMKSIMAEMVKNVDMVIFNRCSSGMDLGSYRRSMKALNSYVQIVFEDKNGDMMSIAEQLPYDVNANVIEVDDCDYGIWYMDVSERPEVYKGKTVRFKGQVLKNKYFKDKNFVPGRKVMTCCAEDTSFIGYISFYDLNKERTIPMIQDILPRHLDNQFRWLTPQKSDIILLFEGSSVLAKWQDEKIYYPDYEEFCTQTDAAKYTFIYVLSVDEIQYFLAMRKGEVLEGSFQGELSDAKVHEEYQSELDGYDFLGVNIFRSAVPKYRAFAAITAYHLYGWYRDNRFCGRCGKPMVHDKKERMVRCMCCNNMVFPKICPAVIIGVTDGDRILLTKYAGRTYKNYALVAGFTEIGETLEQTVEREVMEEVGLHVKNIRYYKSQPWALSGSLLAGFFCELDGDDTISLQEDELSVGKWAHADDLELEDDGISLTREMILKFKEEHAKR